jgi:hypothetical protein
MKLAAEKIVRGLGSVMRSGSRVAAGRRREHPRQYRQTATATATLIVSRARAFMRAHTSIPPRLKPLINPTTNNSDALEV